MPGPTILEFACIANACYSPDGSALVSNFTRVHPLLHANGFKGSIWKQGSGGSMIQVIALAGTDIGDDTGGFDAADVLADTGFAGRTATARIGDRLPLAFDLAAAHLFDPVTTRRLGAPS